MERSCRNTPIGRKNRSLKYLNGCSGGFRPNAFRRNVFRFVSWKSSSILYHRMTESRNSLSWPTSTSKGLQNPIPTCAHYYAVFTYLLTYSMVQSPSWAANWFAASKEIPRISRNPKVHYRTRKRPPPVSILGQPNPVHIPTSHLLDTYLLS